jgi:hypothetical protein
VERRKRRRRGEQRKSGRPTRRPDLISELAEMRVLDVLVWDYMTAAQFHSLTKYPVALVDMRFRTFKEFYKGKLKLFVVRVH